MVEGGDIDVLTGDWLAELTMLILHKQRARNSEVGYASTFLTQMEQVLGPCVERGIKVVSNAGGLNPAGCADRVRNIADRLGIGVSVAHIDGDDLMPRVDGLRPQLANLDTGEPLTADPVTANAYLGAWGIAA
ncbi:MAG: acyclic terpene utilization AtuA family protein, partial [Ilumatobacteraceae bacterium]